MLRVACHLTIINNPEYDEPGIACVEHRAAGFGQPPVVGHWHMLHRDGMIDISANDADLRLVLGDNDVAMPGEVPAGQLLVGQLGLFARVTDTLNQPRRVHVHSLGYHHPT